MKMTVKQALQAPVGTVVYSTGCGFGSTFAEVERSPYGFLVVRRHKDTQIRDIVTTEPVGYWDAQNIAVRVTYAARRDISQTDV